MPQANPYPLRIDIGLMDKLKFIAAENGRSVNKEIEFLIKDAIRRFEAQNGEIPTQSPSV